MTTPQLLFCPDCAADRSFESPGCQDGHGLDCLELACVECGAAVLLGSLFEEFADIVYVPVRRAA